MTEPDRDIGRHPRGTLAIIGIYGVVFVLGWLALFVFVYLPRGAVTR